MASFTKNNQKKMVKTITKTITITETINEEYKVDNKSACYINVDTLGSVHSVHPVMKRRPCYAINEQKLTELIHSSPSGRTAGFGFRNSNEVKFIIRYLKTSVSNYPFHKILTHLKKKFNGQFKNSLSYESFKVKYINIKGGDKRYDTIHIIVGIDYNNPRALEIHDLGNKFQNHTLNDGGNQIIFLLQNYEM